MQYKSGRDIAVVNYVWQSISKLLNYGDYTINMEKFPRGP